jgi:indole-3-glycerol phosphate synthase
MAMQSRERAAMVPPIASGQLDKPVVPLRFDAFDIIAEIKNESPAEGLLAAAGEDRAGRARQYAEAAVLAVSVLTEPSRFAGELAHLEEVVAAIPDTPVMRKDFLVEPGQILEARAAGASGVLLIVTMLSDVKLREMLDCAGEHGLFVLLECFDASDLSQLRAILTSADSDRAEKGELLFGINTRNLRTLTVDADRLETLADKLPPGRVVAESGIRNAGGVARAARLGYSIALVGTALMRSRDPAALIRTLCAAGRRVA